MQIYHGNVRVNEREAQCAVTCEGGKYPDTHPHDIPPRPVDEEPKDWCSDSRDDVDQTESESGDTQMGYSVSNKPIYRK